MASTRHLGIGLVELILGLAVGLGVILATHTAYQAQRQSWLLMQGIHALHHNANAAFDHLQTSLQSANAVKLQDAGNGTTMLIALPTTDWGLSEGKSRSDALALSHFRVLNDSDCQGNYDSSQSYIRDSYQANDKQELTCKDTQTAGSTYQAIAEGVEDFQLLYAERSSPQTPLDTPQWQWKNADHIVSTAQVMAIEICLRMVSTQVVNIPSTEMWGCQGEPVMSDGKLRRVLRRVVAIRSNVSPTSP